MGGIGRLILGNTFPAGGLDERDAATSPGVYLALGASKVWFPRTGAGFGNGTGDFRDLSLEFDDTAEEYVISSPEGDRMVFGLDGLIKRREDRRGNEELFAFDGSDRIESITDAAGLETTFTYATDEVTVADDYGNETILAFDTGRLETVTWEDPDGGGALLAPQEVFTYTTNGSIATHAVYPIESNGPGDAEVTELTYFADGRLEMIERPSGQVEVFSPSLAVGSGQGSLGSPVPLTLAEDVYGYVDNDGGITQTKFNEFGQPLEVVRNYIEVESDPLSQNITTTYEYYDSGDSVSDLVIGRLESVTSSDPDGTGAGESAYVMTYQYDGATGLLETITYPDSTTEEFVYGTSSGSLNLVREYTDRLARVVIYAYDASGNRIREQRAVGTADTLNLSTDPYNLSGNDAVTTWEFGSTGAAVEGLPTAVIDARGHETNYFYTALGNLEKEIVAVGEAIQATRYFVYNANDQLERVYTELWNPDNYPTGAYANWAAAKDVGHYYESYVYDTLGRMTSKTEIDPDGTASVASPVWTYTYDRENRVKTVIDPVGRLTVYVHQSNGDYSQELPDHDGNGLKTITTYQVDERGRTVGMIDPMHYTTSYDYDDLDRLISTTLPDPDELYAWDEEEEEWVQTPEEPEEGPDSPVTSTLWDALSRPVSETDARGQTTHYFYFDDGNTVEVWRPSPDGALPRPITITQHFADGSVDRVIEGSVPYNADPEDAHVESGQSGYITRTLLRWTRHVYDDLGRVTEVWRTMPDETSAPTTSNDFLAERYTYDKNGNRTKVEVAISITSPGSRTAPVMQATDFEFDERNRMIEKTEQDPDGSSPTTDQPVWGYTYDLQGRLTNETDPAGKVTDLNYDRLSRRTSFVLPDPDGSGPLSRPWYITTFDAMGRVSKETDPLGNYQVFFFDPIDDNWTKYDKAANNDFITITYMLYNANQQLVSTNVGMRQWNMEYDALGRTTKVTQPDPDDDMEYGETYTDTALSDPRPFVTYAYDANGNRTGETNELGETTTYAFDYLNRLTSRTDPEIAAGTPVTSYTYDVFGNRLTLDDPEDNTTTWTYDLLDRVKSERNELDANIAAGREFTWNVRGDLLTKEDRLDRLLTYTYDLLGRRTMEKWSTIAAPTTFTGQYAFTYDTHSRLKTAVGTGVSSEVFSDETFFYNYAGWDSSHIIINGTLLKSSFGYTYNLGGLLTNLTNNFSAVPGFGSGWKNDYKNDYTYDGKNRLATLKQSSQSASGTNNVVASKYVVLDYNEHDELIEVDRYANTTNSNLVAHSDYAYDNVGRVTGIDHLKSSTHFATYALEYDDRSRITDIDEVFSNSSWTENHDFLYDETDQLTSADHSVQSDEAYGYDENGNRTGNQTHLGGTASSTVTANNLISTDGVYNYTYDDEGNMLTKTKISTGDKRGIL